MTADEKRLRDWLIKSSITLGIDCRPNYLINGMWFPAYLPHFGGTNGMVIGAIGRNSTKVQSIYVSLVNPEVYSGDAIHELREALNDWGWFGPIDLRPNWYTGQPHNTVQPAAGLRR